MSQRRVCDVCSVRRIRCDGQEPCIGCVKASLPCTRSRERRRPGPKGLKKSTLEKANALRRPNAKKQSSSRPAIPSRHGSQSCAALHLDGSIDDVLQLPALESYPPQDVLSEADNFAHWSNTGTTVHSTVPTWPYMVELEALNLYLDIYHHKLYPVWPIVHVASLVERLRAPEIDQDAYMLASSVCITTMLQLQLVVPDDAGTLSACLYSQTSSLNFDRTNAWGISLRC